MMPNRDLDQHNSLQRGLNTEGRPAWEPPVFDYSLLVDAEEHLKRRAPILQHYESDVVKTTKFLGMQAEVLLLKMHRAWTHENTWEAEMSGDSGVSAFFTGLEPNFALDHIGVSRDFFDLRVGPFNNVKGLYYT